MAYTDKLAGKAGLAKAGSTTLQVTDWTFTDTSDELDSTDSGSSGYGESIAGVKKGNGTVSANWNKTTPQTGTTPGLFSGANIALTLYVDATNYINIPVALIGSCTTTMPVKGIVTFNFNYVTVGSFTHIA